MRQLMNLLRRANRAQRSACYSSKHQVSEFSDWLLQNPLPSLANRGNTSYSSKRQRNKAQTHVEQQQRPQPHHVIPCAPISDPHGACAEGEVQKSPASHITPAHAPEPPSVLGRFHVSDIQPVLHMLLNYGERARWDDRKQLWVLRDMGGEPVMHVSPPKTLPRPRATDSPLAYYQQVTGTQPHASGSSQQQQQQQEQQEQRLWLSKPAAGEEAPSFTCQLTQPSQTAVSTAVDMDAQGAAGNAGRLPSRDLQADGPGGDEREEWQAEEEEEVCDADEEEHCRAEERHQTKRTGPQSSALEPSLMVLLSHDSAALGLWDASGQLVRSKVLTGYTIRRKQGKAQASYERQGGRHNSVGGSIRYQETKRLWQAVASQLHAWRQDISACSRLFCSGDVRVWNLLYEARDPVVSVDRDDPRWERVGQSVPRPRSRDLHRCYQALCYGEVQLLRPSP
mmetsp:Transcript_19599/g.42523  ORF Transcript_19599/g.42523 Transcript_19599/m.42523 type:complete len:452 (-) Transcript_19599:550-1905(-)